MTAMANTHKAWRLHAHNDLRFDEVETPKPAPDGVLVRIEAAMVLSYMGRVLSGSVPYSLPPMPFVPGTNAIARVIAMGAGRVVAVGRKREALEGLREAFDPRVIPAVVTGDAAHDLVVIRHAAGGSADVALDLLGAARSTSTTLSSLRALKRGGRLVLMGSAEVPLEISFREMLANDWEVVGQ